MKKVLLDLNIILDFLGKRDDHEAAVAIYDHCIRKNVKGFICSHEITTLSYFLEKQKYPVRKRNEIITKLLDELSVLTAHEQILRNALVSKIKDFEDAVIDELALKEGIDVLVTRNIKDFSKSKNTIMNARETLEYLEDDLE